jgi:hypothetical protein
MSNTAGKSLLMMSVLVSLFLFSSLVLANGPAPIGGGGGGGNSPIHIMLIDPDQYAYAKNWDTASRGFTFNYTAETDPYYCQLMLDGQPVSGTILHIGSQVTLYSNTTIDEGWHSWFIY